MTMLTGCPGTATVIYTKHSQTTDIPVCPSGYTKLWEGYSLLHTEDSGRANVQDLGKLHQFCFYYYSSNSLRFFKVFFYSLKLVKNYKN